MEFKVLVTGDFKKWWSRLSKGQREDVMARVELLRRAVLLVGGDKTGRWDDWYGEAIARADELYEQHLAQLAEREEN